MEAISKTSILEKIVKLILIPIAGTILITISAKIKIPFYPVPMTMQTFTILLIGITLGYKIGMATVTLYLLEGIFGLPVFANSPEKGVGLIYFTGPTMGYLIGFIVAVFFAGKFNYNKGLINTLIKLLFSVSFIYILGLIWLGLLIGWDKPIFQLGAQPFLFAELFKILLLLFLTPLLIKFRNFMKIT